MGEALTLEAGEAAPGVLDRSHLKLQTISIHPTLDITSARLGD